jgi:patatin-related protein
MLLETRSGSKASPMRSEETPEIQIGREVRFAVVMYGGVSLAIYINGVVQELFHMVRATAAKPDDESTPLIPNSDLSEAEKVYRRLAQIIDRKDGVMRGGDDLGPIRTRFVIDILSGTSAGGINAIYLAKALANGQEIKQLKDLWLKEGDIEKLINDRQSVKDLDGFEVQKPPKSLLNSQRMYRKLLDAFEGMQDSEGSKKPRFPYVEELDLYVTATDICGLPIKLRLADKVVQEKRHRNVFHFRYSNEKRTRNEDRNDFHEGNNKLLAFAARCTSAFPFAFEPMRFEDIGSAIEKPLTDADYDRWKDFFPDYLQPSTPHSQPKEDKYGFKKIAFGDGGYLDNKPFGYATDAIATRRSGLPVSRRLIYIEPSPEHVEALKVEERNPNAIENVAAALSLARYETIREDLQRINDRNRLAERAARIISGVEDDVGQALPKPLFTRKNFAKMDLKQMIKQGGIAYGGYHRLKIGAVMDEIAALIARAAGFDPQSGEFLAIRYMVQAWRDRNYTDYKEVAPDKETQNKFLLDYDLWYRIRRLEFVLNRVDQLRYDPYSPGSRKILEHRENEGPEPGEEKEFRDEFGKLGDDLGKLFDLLRAAREKLELTGHLNPLAEEVAAIGLGSEQLQEILDEPDDERRLEHARELIDAPEKKDAFDRLASRLRGHIGVCTKRASRGCMKILAVQDEPGDEPRKFARTAREIAQHYYDYFDRYDPISYPILYSIEVGEELGRVEVIRISPRDATCLIDENKSEERRRKLAGTSLRNFGAFLDRGWRQNDLLWGRLDGAERIITTLLPDSSRKEDRDELIKKAQLAILIEELPAPDRDKLSQLFADVLARTNPTKDSEKRLREFVKKELDPPIDSALGPALRSLLSDEQLRKFFKDSYEVNREMNPEGAVRVLSRSTRVVGKMLEDISNQYQVNGKAAAWLTRLGSVFWGVVEVAVPRSLPNLIFRYWVKLLYLFEALLIVGGLLFVVPEVQRLGFIALGITLVFHSGVLALGAWMRHKTKKWKRASRVLLIGALIVLVGALLFLALVGADTLFDLRGRLGLF